jgi:hypothetical protein
MGVGLAWPGDVLRMTEHGYHDGRSVHHPSLEGVAGLDFVCGSADFVPMHPARRGRQSPGWMKSGR